MLEAWLNYYGKGELNVISVGEEPEAHLDIFTARSMMEAVIDIVSQKTKSVDALENKEFDYALIFEDGLSKPFPEDIFAKEKIILDMPNPHLFEGDDEAKLKEFGRVRDIIEDYALDFVNDYVKKIF